MDTKSVFKVINRVFGENHLAVCSLGRTSEESFLNLPNAQVLYLDCLGAVTEMAIGIALGCQDSLVYAFDTDGSFLSNISSVYSLSILKGDLDNLTLFIFDNQILESSGKQKSASENINWEALFLAWDLKVTRLHTIEDLTSFFNERFSFHGLKIAILDIDNREIVDTCHKNIDGIESKYLFKRHISDNINKGIIKPCVKN